MGQRVVRFSVTPPPRKAPRGEAFAAQLALAQVHPCLVPVERTLGGYTAAREPTRDWFDLHPKRGLAGYGLARALRMLLDVLAGVSALEQTRNEAGQPFVHGELVPAMIRVDRSGTARLMPIAPWHWAEPGRLPASDRCGHLAPERLLGDAIDARADVFSAGALLWEALAGCRLFETDSVDAIVTRLMGAKVTLPELPPELSWAAPLKAISMCALSVDPEQRFANCAELAEAIAAVAGHQLATHDDVASYFGSPHLAAHPSVMAHPPPLPTHPSSLSAMVAQVLPSAPAKAPRSDAPTRDSRVTGRRVQRPLWAIAAISCLLSALGATAIARYKAAHDERHSAVRSAPPLAVSLAAAARLPSAAVSTRAAPARREVADPKPIETSEAAIETAISPKDDREKPSKAAKGAAKGAAPQLKSKAKTARPPDRAAAKYGI